jgi:hypothetical protein
MSNKSVENISDDLDPILNELAESVSSVSDSVDQSEDHAMFILGVKYMNEDSKDGEGVQTYINVGGYFGILEEGLYAELMDQVKNGHLGLFTTIRSVVRDIEEELGISPDEEIQDENTPSTYLH